MYKLIFFLFFSSIVSAQNLSRVELLDALSTEVCDQMSQDENILKNEMLFGLFILKTINKYETEIKFHYGENFIYNGEGISSISEEIGYNLALKCPDFLMNYVDQENQVQESGFNSVTGKLIKIKKDKFLTFTIKEESGKTNEFLLLNDFETSYLLTDNLLKANDLIEVTFYVSQFYDSKIGKFVNYNVVSYIEKK